MMRVPVEGFAFVMYLDSLFTETRTREVVAPARALPETLNRLFAQAMREHARESALLYQEDGTWRPTPDWRLDRHVIRAALYLRERLNVEPGTRVAVISELRPERLIADFAALGLGAISVSIDARLQGQELADALAHAEPQVTFVTAAVHRILETHDGRAPAHGQLIMLDGPAGTHGIPFAELLEHGGTLDTPERAQTYRSEARSLWPDSPAIRHYQQAPGGGWNVVELSQGGVIERLRAEWLGDTPRPGDVAYLSDPIVSLAARLAVYAFLGDGYTTTALAAASGKLSDFAVLHPTKIVAPAALLAEAIHAADVRAEARRDSDGGWRRQAARLVPLARARKGERAVGDVLGGRARWVRSTDPLESALAERFRGVAVAGPIANSKGGVV